MEKLPFNQILHYDHVGYGCHCKKEFYARERGTGSFVIKNDSGETVFEGSLEHGLPCKYTGETLFRGNFSEVQVEGKYKIILMDKGGLVLACSEYFEISDKLLERQLKANIKSFFYQRSGVDIPREYAGEWARKAAHVDSEICFHPSMNREGVWNAHGGWYDAGDYGKYVVNGGVSVATLLLACEMCKGELFVGNENFEPSFEQPFSMLEELRFELEFFLRMQDDDGGVFFKVTPERWDGFVSPLESDAMQKRMILGKSTSSTLNFAAVMAQAHRVYESFDAEFSAKCLAASLRAYAWASRNPAVDWPHNTEGSGGYGDDCVDDEFFWARTMLFLSLREEQNKKNIFDGNREQRDLFDSIRLKLPLDMEHNPPKLGLDWRDTQNMGWIALSLMEDCRDAYEVSLRRRARMSMETVADKIMSLQKADAYSVSVPKFIWGSNGDISNHALTLLVVYTWQRKRELLDNAMEQVHFIYGRNPVNVCFVTGAAWSSPKHPHHRICGSDGVEKPIPGLLVGGINEDRQDLHRFAHYPSEFSGLSYTDEQCSFASNETAINWNAPLTAVLAYLRACAYGFCS